MNETGDILSFGSDYAKINTFFSKCAGVSEIKSIATVHNIPWILSILIQQNNRELLHHSINDFVHTSNWDPEAFKYFFNSAGRADQFLEYASKVEENNTREVIALILVVQCDTRFNPKTLEAWESLSRFKDKGKVIESFEESRRTDDEWKYLFVPGQLKHFWFHPTFAAHIIKRLLKTTANDGLSLNRTAAESIPIHLYNFAYTMEIIVQIETYSNESFSNFSCIPKRITERMIDTFEWWKTSLTIENPSNQLISSEARQSSLTKSIQKTFITSMEKLFSSDRRSLRVLDYFNYFLEVQKTGVVTIQDISSAFLKRCNQEAQKEAFFSQARLIAENPFFCYLPVNIIRCLLPKSAVGGAAKKFLKDLEIKTKAVTPMERKVYVIFASLLGERVAENDPFLPDDTIESGNVHQKVFGLEFLSNSFRKLEIAKHFVTLDSAVEILDSEFLDHYNLFGQCISYWGKGKIASERKSIPTFSPKDLRLKDLRLVLSKRNRAEMLEKHTGVCIVPLAECEAFEEEVHELNRLVDIQVLCSYHPKLQEEFAKYLEIEKGWLDGPSEKKWMEERIGRLLECKKRIVAFFNHIPSEVQHLLSKMNDRESKSKSILFDTYMRDYFYVHGTTDNVVDDLRKGIEVVRDKLENFFRSLGQQTPLPVSDVQEVFTLLRKGNWNLQSELLALASSKICKELEGGSKIEQIEERMITVGQNCVLLQEARRLLHPAEGQCVLKEFQFECTRDGAKDLLLLACTKESDGEAPAKMNIQVLGERAAALRQHFPFRSSAVELSRIFSVLADLRKFQHVWNFFLHNPTFIGDGMYNYNFIELVDGYISKLRTQKAEVISRFKFMGQFVVVLLRGRQKQTFSEVTAWLVNNPLFQKQLSAEDEDWSSFLENLEQVNHEMRVVEDVFKEKEDPFDAVVAQYEQAQSGYCYYYDLDGAKTFMSYMRGDSVERLSTTDTQEFQLQLSFAVRDDISRFKESGGDAEGFLHQLEKFSRKLELLQQLHSTGHPKFSASKLVVIHGKGLRCSEEGFTSVNLRDMEKLEELQEEWLQRQARTQKEHPWLSLVSPPLAMEIAWSMQKGGVNAVRRVMGMVSHLLDATKVDPQTAISEVCHCRQKNVREDWLEFLTRAFASLEGYLPQPQTVTSKKKETECTLYSCEGENEVWSALEKVYQKRNPLAFEVLWCEPSTNLACLNSLLERASQFPQYVFTIVRSDLLPYVQQQLIVRFLLNSEAIENIHFIECAESLIRSAHRVKTVVPCNTPLRALVYPVQCFRGPSGSGKTFQIRRKIQELPAGSYTVCAIVVNESFSLTEAIMQLRKGIEELEEGHKLVVAFRFSVGCYAEAEKGKWLALFRHANTFLFSVLKMRFCEDTTTGRFVTIAPKTAVEVLVELPPDDFFLYPRTSGVCEDLMKFFPVLQVSESVKVINSRDEPMVLDDDAAVIASYLKANDDGVINAKFDNSYREDFDALFLLDVSGSMRLNGRLDVCKESIIELIQKMSSNDRVGLSTYNNTVSDIWDMNYCTPGNIRSLRDRLEDVMFSGGSCLFSAVAHGCKILLNHQEEGREMFLVVLSDGGPENTGYLESFQFLRHEGREVHIIFIAIEISPGYKFSINNFISRGAGKDFFLETTDKKERIHEAFNIVGEQMSVNEKIKKHALEMDSSAIPELIWKYMKPKEHPEWSRVHLSLWLRYMRRRCNILASSKKFDQNVDMDHYGSTTMELMLLEAEHAVGKAHVQWCDRTHEHMVYHPKIEWTAEGEATVDYSWSVIAVHQEKDPRWAEKKKILGRLRMYVPDERDMEDPRVLESYLAYGVGVPLESPVEVESYSGRRFDFPLGSLPVLRRNRFVLTVDYTMKMLLINERVKCLAPCIVMGETGVSKTKVTEMLFKLKNSGHEGRVSELSDILNRDTKEPREKSAVLQELCGALRIPVGDVSEGENSILGQCRENAELRDKLAIGLLEVLREDPSLDPLLHNRLSLEDLKHLTVPESACATISWFLSLNAAERYADRRNWMFEVVNMHSAMTAKEITAIVKRVADRVRRVRLLGNELPHFLLHRQAEICIFFDEFNTSSCLGLLKEIIQDRSLHGEDLPKELVPIAACNPYRERKQVHDTARMNEQGTDWISGHYNVRPLPKSLDDMTWDYGSLLPAQEEEFIRKRLSFEKLSFASPEAMERLVQCVTRAHGLTRSLAEEHMTALLENVGSGEEERKLDSVRRGNSAVSLRDILRFFRMFHYFRKGAPQRLQRLLFRDDTGCEGEEKRVERAMVLGIAVVYYLRLNVDSDPSRSFRKKFWTEMKNTFDVDVAKAVEDCTVEIMRWTNLGPGVVQTKSLRENITAILLSLAARTPLIIKGPPGTSKTLAVQILCDNAHGDFGDNEFYRALPSMSSVHYQCSRQSSSKEITEVFERAIRNQKSADEHGSGETVYFVFMDEAGLPEEERESLKVLHYYLESNTRRSTEVGFVAITNQLLDAANSNRCNMLSRAKYDGEELKTLAEGCCRVERGADQLTTLVTLNGQEEVTMREIIDYLCYRFEEFVAINHGEVTRKESLLSESCTDFFSLRDFMHLFKLLGRMLERLEAERRRLSVAELVEAFQRNFNGLETDEVRGLLRYFLSGVEGVELHLRTLMNPVALLRKAIEEGKEQEGLPVSRYLLVTDTTTCDGVLKELTKYFSVQLIRMGMFPQSANQEEMRALGEVCWRAAQGHLIGLSGTASIHESLYDLFNQHYKLGKNKDGTRAVLCTNVAVGSLSVSCDVGTSFGCIVFVNEEELLAAPAAFLDRLEKYRICMSDVLHHYLEQHQEEHHTALWGLVGMVVKPLHEAMSEFFRSVGWDAFFGVREGQSLESAILSLLRRWESCEALSEDLAKHWTCLVAVREGEGVVEWPSTPNAPGIQSWLTAQVLGKKTSPTTVMAVSVLLETAEREIMSVLLRVAIPEKALPRLPPALVDLYLIEEHFTAFGTATATRPLLDEAPMKELLITRYVGNRFLKDLETGQGKMRVVNFSVMSSEAEFKENLERAWNSKTRVVLYFNFGKFKAGQLNFCRDCIEELYKHRPQPVAILVSIASSDAMMHCGYDTTFHTGWVTRFLDAVGTQSILPWLRVGYRHRERIDTPAVFSGPADTGAEERQTLEDCLTKDCALSLAGVVECIPHVSTGKRKFYIRPAEISNVFLAQWTTTGDRSTKSVVTFGDVVAQSFASEFLEEFKNQPVGEALRTRIQKVVQSQADSPLTSCLSQTIQTELNDLLSRKAVSVLKEVIPALPRSIWRGNPKPMAMTETVEILLRVIQSVPSQALLAERRKDLVHEEVPLPYASGFPFYRQVQEGVSHALSLAYDDTDDEAEAEEETLEERETIEEWSEVLDTARRSVHRFQDVLMAEATLALWNLRKSSPLFHVYVENFLADAFPFISGKTHKYLLAWLLPMVEEEQCIPMLHITFIRRRRWITRWVKRMERIHSQWTTTAKSRSRQSEDEVVEFLFAKLESILQAKASPATTELLQKLVTTVSQVSSEAWVSLSSASKIKSNIIVTWVSALVTERTMGGSAPRAHSVSPLLASLFTELCKDLQHPGSCTVESLAELFSKAEPNNWLVYLARLHGKEGEVGEWARQTVWKGVRSVRFSPAVVALAGVETRSALLRQPIKVFASFHGLLQAVSSPQHTSLDYLLQVSAYGGEGALPPWVAQEGALLFGSEPHTSTVPLNAVGPRAVFVLLWKWLLAWHHHTPGKEGAAMLAIASEVSQVAAEQSGVSPLLQRLGLAALVKLLVLLLAQACKSGGETEPTQQAEGEGEGMDACVPVLRRDPKLWVELLAQQLSELCVKAKEVERQCRRWKALKPLLEEAQKIRTPRAVRGKNTLKPIASPIANAFQDAAKCFPEEMQLLQLLRFLWLLPLTQEVYRWVWSSRDQMETNLLEISDASNVSRYHLMRAGVAELRAWWPSAASPLPEVPEKAYPSQLLSKQCSDGSVQFGVLEEILRRVLELYGNAERWSKTFFAGTARRPFPKASSLYDVENLVGGNDRLLADFRSARCRKAVTMEEATALIRAQGHHFQVCSAVADALETPFLEFPASTELDCLKKSHEMVEKELRWRLQQSLIEVPDSVWAMERVGHKTTLGSLPTTAASKPEVVSRRLLLRLLHSLTRQGLQQLDVVLQRVMEQDTEGGPTPKRLVQILERWMEGSGGTLEWLSEFIGLGNLESCAILGSFLVSEVGKVREFIAHQIEQQAYLLAEKAIELKEELPERVVGKVMEVLSSVPTHSLTALSRFFATQEERLERHARQSPESPLLIPLLGSVFPSRETLYRQHPVLHRLEQLWDDTAVESGEAAQHVALRSTHYVALRLCLLREVRRREPPCRSHGLRSSTWTWQTAWQTAVIASPAEERDAGDRWDFLRPTPEGTTDTPPCHGSRRVGRTNYRSTRAQLLAKVKAFDESARAAEEIEALMAALPPLDNAPLTRRAAELLEGHITKTTKMAERLRQLVGAGAAHRGRTHVDTREIEEALACAEKLFRRRDGEWGSRYAAEETPPTSRMSRVCPLHPTEVEEARRRMASLRSLRAAPAVVLPRPAQLGLRVAPDAFLNKMC